MRRLWMICLLLLLLLSLVAALASAAAPASAPATDQTLLEKEQESEQEIHCLETYTSFMPNMDFYEKKEIEIVRDRCQENRQLEEVKLMKKRERQKKRKQDVKRRRRKRRKEEMNRKKQIKETGKSKKEIKKSRKQKVLGQKVNVKNLLFADRPKQTRGERRKNPIRGKGRKKRWIRDKREE